MQAASLWAGTSTVTVTGPAYTPWVSRMTTFGASGSSSGRSERRSWLLMRRSRNATPAAKTSASPNAAIITRGEGAWVS